MLLRNTKYRANNKETILENKKIYYAKNKEEISKRAKQKNLDAKTELNIQLGEAD